MFLLPKSNDAKSVYQVRKMCRLITIKFSQDTWKSDPLMNEQGQWLLTQTQCYVPFF